MAIKPAWIVCGVDGFVVMDEKAGEPQEFKSEAAAVKRAKEWVKAEADSQAWVFRLTHVVSTPEIEPEPDVEEVKYRT